jgi:hypothetical protein
MGFFAPWFLAGLAAVGIPVWVHLLKRHKTDPKLFPSLMFFEQREQSSVKHRKLDYLLLFALRTAMIILLALLFASPFIRRSNGAAGGKKITVVAVDRSFSMRAGNRLAQAKDEAMKVVNNLKPGDQAQVIALGGNVQALTQVVTDPAQLRAAVTAIQPSDSRASFGELARYLRTLADAQKLPLDVHLASDLQKSAMPPGFADLRVNPGTTLFFHPVGDPAPNWTVENVVAPRRVYDPKRVRMQATVAGYGTTATKRDVALLLNGRMLQSKSVDVPANGRGQVEFLGLDAPRRRRRAPGRRSLSLFGGARRSAQGPVRRRWPASTRGIVFSRGSRFRGRRSVCAGVPTSGIGGGCSAGELRVRGALGCRECPPPAR